LARIDSWVAEGGFHQLATANTDFLINAVHDQELGDILRRCDLVVADGMPLVWTSRLLGSPLKARVTGVDLVPQLAQLAAARGYRVFLLGGLPDSTQGAARALKDAFPDIQLVGQLSPAHAPLEEMDHASILECIAGAEPDILLVAFGNPKQEKWLAMHRHRLRVPVTMGVGGTFDFLSGHISRAPYWMQRSGLEWLYRTFQEPRRLAARYASNAYGLLRHLPQQLVAFTFQRRAMRLPQLMIEASARTRILHISGDFTGPVIQSFAEETLRAFTAGSHVVLDLSQSTYIGPDALGMLIRAMSDARTMRRELWLTGLRPLVQRVVKAGRFHGGLQIASGIPEAMRRIEPIGSTGIPVFSGSPRLLAFRDQEISPAYRAFRHTVRGTSAISPAAKEPAQR
jgi:N-acetylglucosaminyldiphosphoundecaprenol N-acetyl-beta-D-mannosaminyltransferase